MSEWGNVNSLLGLLSGLLTGARSISNSPTCRLSTWMWRAEQRQRRPAQRDVLGIQPDALVVAELQLVQIQCRWERAVDSGELHVTVGEAARRADDECAPALGVADDQHARPRAARPAAAASRASTPKFSVRGASERLPQADVDLEAIAGPASDSIGNRGGRAGSRLIGMPKSRRIGPMGV